MRARDHALRVSLAGAIAVTVALWRTRFQAIPTADGTWVGAAGWPSLLVLAASVIGGIAAALWLERYELPVRLPFLVLAAAAAPLVPFVTGHWLALLAIQGPLLFLVVLCAVCVATVRSQKGRYRPPPALLFGVALFFYALLGTRLPGPAGPQGDEPHYLVMCQSLLSDGDLDLTDEYAHHEYRSFYAGELNQPHLAVASPSGPSYSFHSPGLPVLLLPGFALGGYEGARAVLWIVAALTGVLVHRLVRETLGDETVALAAWAAVTFAPPLALFAMTIYPEVPATLATAVFLLTGRRNLDARGAAAAALCAAFLPWLHSKFVVLAAIGLLLTLVRPGRWLWRGIAVSAFACSIALLLLTFHRWYGHASLTAAYGNPNLSLERIPRGLLALLMDRQFGLLPAAPLWFLGLAGLVPLWRRARADALRALLLAAPVVGIAAAFADWTGGTCPPARYLLPTLPVLGLGLAAAIPRRATAATVLCGMGVGVVALAAEAPRIFHNWPDGESHLLRHLAPTFDLGSLLPSFFEPGIAPYLLALGFMGAAALAWRFGTRGLAGGALGYLLLAASLHRLPPLNPRVAATAVLESWNGANWNGRGGPLPLSSLRIPFAFVRAPDELQSGTSLRSDPPFSLPPGRYRLSVGVRAAGGPPTRVHVTAASRGVLLGAIELDDAQPASDLPLVLPVGVLHLQLGLDVLEGRAALQHAYVVPDAVVPAGERDGLDWPRTGSASAYRIESGRLRVTAIEGSVPDATGFRIEGDGRFVVEAPSGSTVEAWIERQVPDARQVMSWGRREVPLGRLPGVRVWLSANDGVPLGGTMVCVLRLRAPGAWIRLVDRPGAGAAGDKP